MKVPFLKDSWRARLGVDTVREGGDTGEGKKGADNSIAHIFVRQSGAGGGGSGEGRVRELSLSIFQ